jgi:riboflavin kinase/FMN adenylyltransferase
VELVRGLTNLPARYRGAAVTIGGFDGLHLGHRALIGRALDLAQRMARPAMMMTFEPLPREFLASKSPPPPRLTSFRERWRVLEGTGLAALCILRFDEDLRCMPGERFVELLARDLAATAVVVGHDFKFGRDGAMTAAVLARVGRQHGFEVDVVPPVLLAGERVSSSNVRAALDAGDFANAARLLGRPYTMRGRVVRGAQLGRTLGYPTANLKLHRKRTPVQGIFAVRVHGVPVDVTGGAAQERSFDGVASLGTRPTVNGVEPLLEAHIFEYAGDLYGRELEVEFVAKLREELKFESLDALVAQMHRDAAEARLILAA